MAAPNRRYPGGQTPPIFDRSKMRPPLPQVPGLPPVGHQWDAGHGGWQGPGNGPMGGMGPPQPVPGGGMGQPQGVPGYGGYGIANMFQRLGHQYDVGSIVPTGGFGFDQGQKGALAPFLQQLPGILGQRLTQREGPSGGPVGGIQPFELDSSGGVLKALQSLGVDTGNSQGLGIGGDQRAQFMHSLQDLITSLNTKYAGGDGGPPNRRPDFPGRYSPGYRNPNIPGY